MKNNISLITALNLKKLLYDRKEKDSHFLTSLFVVK